MVCDTHIIHFDYVLEQLYSMDKIEGKKKQCSIRNEKLKAYRASETEEQRKERLRIRCEKIDQ